MSRALTVAVAGNPNCGKTTIFNALTGTRQHVGNWPGVTVERKEGRFVHNEQTYKVIDLPGTYSLSTYSVEELVARDFIVQSEPDIIVNVVDASNLERNLFLTTQLIEIGRPMVIALNMMDMAREKGLEIDTETLGVLLGAPVVPIVGRTGEGIDVLKEKIHRIQAHTSQKARHIDIQYHRDIETQIEAISRVLEQGEVPPINVRWVAVKLLEKDERIWEYLEAFSDKEKLRQTTAEAIHQIEKIYQDTSRAAISHARYGFLRGATQECVRSSTTEPVDYSRKIDKVLTNRLFGLPIFALFMWLMFVLTFDLGAYPMDWIDAGISWLVNSLHGLFPDTMLTSLVVDGMIGGVGAIAVFLPNIFILFFVIAILEDSGYMARMAFIMDRVMHTMGLHGKAFIPLVMGFGCNVPAIMGTRILESRRDRILTTLINPFMSCSARLPVYILVAGAFFPENAGTVIFSMYVLGVVVAIISGKLFSKTVLHGMSKPFVLELPPYQKPKISSLLLHTWERGQVFIRKMGSVILVGSIIVWALGYFPREVQLSQDYVAQSAQVRQEWKSQESVIEQAFHASVEKGKQQYVSAMVPFESSGHYKELVAQRDSLQSQTGTVYQEKLQKVDYTRQAETMSQKWIGKMGKLIEPLVAPLGFTWREGVALVTGFVAKEIVVSTYGVLFGVGADANEENAGILTSLRNSGMTPLIGLGFLVFVLLYTPCLATMAAIRRETGSWGWTTFSVVYSLLLAWILAFGIYQIGSAFQWLS
ncbi:MAG: ferrous iron transport protein B [Candidatus Marinimicrobia bacterium]|nr:ferrous iron transport protein B [Candidatus Neomarinimicrobiota bacterium]MCF7839824.1 ferrous iron transport protein B [Candidatus Neomarinimicrobiota bacterium]MCF7902071.1 ferrous iron transport protein B [Candidatus Neomarinimicrobiota bacterium]